MDRIFRSDDKLYISPPIHVGAFLESALAAEERMRALFGLADQPGTSSASLPTFAKFMTDRGFDEAAADETTNNVDKSFKRIHDINPPATFELTFPPKNSALSTHRVLHAVRQDYDTSAVKNTLVMRGKYFKHREQDVKRPFAPSGQRAARDVVCTVHLLAPTNRPLESFESFNMRNRCEVKFLVRGDMPLTKLRNKIFCQSDFWCNLEDYESATNQDAYFSVGQNSYYYLGMNRFPSGFIFIHDTFYIDKRPQCTDISEPIRQFMSRKHDDFDATKVADLAETRIVDLTLRLGQPYVYQHQGSCEHLLIFSDLRTITPRDEQLVDEYPIRIYDSIQPTMCGTCRRSPAVFVVTESDRMPSSPAFMCHDCFYAFHYDGRNRIGNFRAFHFTDRAGIE